MISIRDRSISQISFTFNTSQFRFDTFHEKVSEICGFRHHRRKFKHALISKIHMIRLQYFQITSSRLQFCKMILDEHLLLI